MKVVQLSAQDRAIIRAVISSTAIGKATVEELRSLLKAEDAIKMDEVPKNLNVPDMSDTPDEYKVEDAQYDALKKAVEGDGKANLSRLVMRQYVNCVDHISVAKDAE